MGTLQRIRNDRRVETVDDEREIGNGVIVTLRPGWAYDPSTACHVFGEDTVSAALRTLRDVKPCACDFCTATQS